MTHKQIKEPEGTDKTHAKKNNIKHQKMSSSILSHAHHLNVSFAFQMDKPAACLNSGIQRKFNSFLRNAHCI